MTNFDKKANRKFSNFRIAQERETLSKYFGEMDNGNVSPFLLMELKSNFIKHMWFFLF